MSARRQARARDTGVVVESAGGLPLPLAIGRCIEVWAEEGAAIPSFSARSRFGIVRDWWLDRAGLLDTFERYRLIPSAAPWSAEYMEAAGHGAYVRERLARAGCTRLDLPTLAEEAQELHALANLEDPRGAMGT